MRRLSINGYYYSSTGRPNFNDISFYLPESKNVHELGPYLDPSPLYIFQPLTEQNIDSARNIIRKRTKEKYNTIVVYDFSMEDGVDKETYDKITSLDVPKHLTILNTSALTTSPYIKDALYIDLFAIAAVQRELAGYPANKLKIKDRDNRINLLVGSVSKNRRTDTLYRLHQQNYLKHMLLGLLGDPKELTIQDETFINDIMQYWGSKDDVPLTTNNSSQGYSDNSRIYDQSQVSYICETWEPKKFFEHTFITEKTYRSILNRHPFVIQGPNGILADLKSKGFKTFSPFIDENYENDIDLTISAAKSLLQAVNDHPDQIEEIVEHNYKNLHKLAQEQLTMLEVQLNAF
jgi:hypothetical protein